MAIEWGSVADWFSGAASFAAVATALFLARDAKRVQIRVTCGHRVVARSGMPMPELFAVHATNVGNRSTIVTAIVMRTGRRRKDHRLAVVPFPQSEYSASLPLPLADGESALWAADLGPNREWIALLCDGYVKSAADLDTLRFLVETSNGGTFTAKPEHGLKALIADELQRKNAFADA